MKKIILFILLCALQIIQEPVLAQDIDQRLNTIERWVLQYRKEGQTPLSFAKTFVPLVKRKITSLMQEGKKKEAKQLTIDLVKILDKKKLDIACPSIVAFLYNIDLDIGEPSILADRLLVGIRLIARPAPTIEGVDIKKLKKGKLIVIFYETNCAKCNKQIDELIKRHTHLIDLEYDVISISSDNNKAVFEKESGTFPWSNKLCDYQSFSGINFVNYGVASTPWLFLIDDVGLVSVATNELLDILVEIYN